ncbi:MBL fold metallo-hydrolase [Vulcanisaeta thermophila]|uniref:MBL fold metallo-hydrolase n=1 Tax=Vulcanisaeta thermophila TaxID=867917 RepID=UPI000852F0A9|nr:hypothetical protein [Vulcanisaeta thermophila]
MEIVPIAEESLGVRSMAIFVKTKDLGILLDPGISLSPRRFGLPPHPRELERVRALRRVLERYAESATHVLISHYHRDHFTVPYASIYMGTTGDSYRLIYGGKQLLMKSPSDINWSQKRRYYGLLKAVEGIVRGIVYVDGNKLSIGDTELLVSPSLPHGLQGSRTGRVIAVTISEGSYRFTFMPDVEGPVSQEAMDYLLQVRPQFLVVGGPPLYLNRGEFNEDYMRLAMKNLVSLIRAGFLERLVIAHHALRELNWRERMREVFMTAREAHVEVTTYAGLLNREDELLEARRRELYSAEPPPRDYLEQFRSVRDEGED